MKRAFMKASIENDTLHSIVIDQDSIIESQDSTIVLQGQLNTIFKDSIKHLNEVVIPEEKEKSRKEGKKKGIKIGNRKGIIKGSIGGSLAGAIAMFFGLILF